MTLHGNLAARNRMQTSVKGKTVMSDMLLDIQYDPEQNNYIYSFRMSEQKKCDLEKRLQSYGATLEESIPNYLQAVMDQEDKNI